MLDNSTEVGNVPDNTLKQTVFQLKFWPSVEVFTMLYSKRLY
jgi:hypothetical protein